MDASPGIDPQTPPPNPPSLAMDTGRADTTRHTAHEPPFRRAKGARPVAAWMGAGTAVIAAAVWGSRITTVSINTTGLAPDAAVRAAVTQTLGNRERWCWRAPHRTLRILARLPGVTGATSQCVWPQRLVIHAVGVEPVAWRATPQGIPRLIDGSGREWATPPALRPTLANLPRIQGTVGEIPQWLGRIAAAGATVNGVTATDSGWILALGDRQVLADSGTTAEQLREAPRILRHAQERDTLHTFSADLRWAERVMLRRSSRRETPTPPDTVTMPGTASPLSADARG